MVRAVNLSPLSVAPSIGSMMGNCESWGGSNCSDENDPAPHIVRTPHDGVRVVVPYDAGLGEASRGAANSSLAGISSTDSNSTESTTNDNKPNRI